MYFGGRIDRSQQFIQFMLRACLVKSTMDLGLEPFSLHDETVRFATESFVNLYIAYIDSGIYFLHYSPFLRTKQGSKNTPEYFSSITPLSCVLYEGARTTGENYCTAFMWCASSAFLLCMDSVTPDVLVFFFHY
jgi:hypothetical protein